MAKTLEANILLNTLSVHPKLADSTDSTFLIITGTPCLDDVTLQFSAMVMHLHILTITRKILLVCKPPGL